MAQSSPMPKISGDPAGITDAFRSRSVMLLSSRKSKSTNPRKADSHRLPRRNFARDTSGARRFGVRVLLSIPGAKRAAATPVQRRERLRLYPAVNRRRRPGPLFSDPVLRISLARRGIEVEFEVKQGPKGLQAENVVCA